MIVMAAKMIVVIQKRMVILDSCNGFLGHVKMYLQLSSNWLGNNLKVS